MIRPERLRAAMSGNGRLVHLATSDGQPVCSSRVNAENYVHARITCPGCLRARPRKAARLRNRPLVIGLDFSPLYAAIGRVLDAIVAGPVAIRLAAKEPMVKVRFWPVLG